MGVGVEEGTSATVPAQGKSECKAEPKEEEAQIEAADFDETASETPASETTQTTTTTSITEDESAPPPPPVAVVVAAPKETNGAPRTANHRNKSTRRTRVVADGSADFCHHVSKQMEDLIKVANERDNREEVTSIQDLIVPQKSGFFKRAIPTGKLLQWSKVIMK